MRVLLVRARWRTPLHSLCGSRLAASCDTVNNATKRTTRRCRQLGNLCCIYADHSLLPLLRPTPVRRTQTLQQEPHAKRRREILAKYPEIKDLYGPDWTTPLQVFGVVAAQLAGPF